MDKIYGRLNHRSAVEFGIKDNTSYKLLEDKIKNINYLHYFYKEGKFISLFSHRFLFLIERNRVIDKDNLKISNHLSKIESRSNVKKMK